MRNKEIFHNIYFVLLVRLTIVMFIMSLCRLVFYGLNTDIYFDMNLSNYLNIALGGLRFDLSATIYLNIIYIVMLTLPFNFRYNKVYIKISNIIYLTTNGLGITANIADSIYFPFTLKRTTMAMFHQFSNETNMGALFQRFMLDYWYAIILAILLFLVFFFINKNIQYIKPKFEEPLLFYPRRFITMLLIFYLSIVSIRGGFTMSTRPITLSNASKYINKPTERALVLNTPFAFLRTLSKKNLVYKNYFSDEIQKQIYTAVHSAKKDSIQFQKKNIVIFILESFGRENIGSLNKDVIGYQGYTPFLDSLISKSYTFKHAFANGRKSISAMPSVLSSIPSIVEPFILSNYSGNRINSISEMLKKEGYTSSFFHGAPNGSMGFDAFTNQIKIDHYYGKNEYNNNADNDGFWGIWDDKFFKYFGIHINKMKEPFVTSLFSLTSHHPYKLPKEFEGQFPEGELPLHRVIGYTDYALSQFFKKASQQKWYHNTIFIITADHAPSHFFMPQYGTGAGLFAIPIIIHEPNSNLIGFNDSTIVQQADILPTVLGRMHYPKDYLAFGTDALDPTADHMAVSYIGNTFQIIMDGFLLQFDGENPVNLYNIISDPTNKTNLLNTNHQVQDKLLNKLKAFIQEYNRRLIDNNMYK